MAVFAVNQNRQLYVAKAKKADYSALTDAGDIALVVNPLNKKDFYFTYKGVDTTLRSDIIDIASVVYARHTTADEMARPFNKFKITLSADVNSGAPVSGQDYVLRLFFSEYIGASEKYSTCKYGAVHATSSMDASTFYKTLAVSLAKNFSREYVKLVSITLDGIDGEITPLMKVKDISGTATGVVIEEVEQPWKRGVKKVCAVNFKPYPTTITYEGDDVVWGEVEDLTDSNSNKLKNGKNIADLEYFTAGERGDIYRESAWPNNIDTEYLVDPTKEYDTIDLHYFYSGTGINSEKSEKDITIVAESSVATEVVTLLTDAGITVQEKKS
jgi:hypothetical protein